MATLMRKYSNTLLSLGVGMAFHYAHRKYDTSAGVAYTATSDNKNPVRPLGKWDTNWDGREKKSVAQPLDSDTKPETAQPMAVRHIVLIRHGEYSNADSDTDEMHHLTKRGRLQAKYVGKRLRELGIKWDEVIVSTMIRAQETADIILKEVEYNTEQKFNCALIREGAPVPPQPPIGPEWKAEKAYFRDGARIEAGFRTYFHRATTDETRDTYTLIVAHSNVIRYFVCRALQFPPEAWIRLRLNHASITWLTIHPSGFVSIRYLGDSGFMPVDCLTSSIPRKQKNRTKKQSAVVPINN